MGGTVRRRKKPSRQTSSASSNSSSHGATRHKNISLCLARGATARNLHPTLLQPLTQDEMEKDLRHMQAFANAVKSYQQQFYIQANRNMAENDDNNNDSGALATAPLVSLPVRIDPEEEKRLVNLRKKIARAEVIREEAEQHYVASRAHYVHTVQELEKTGQERFHIMEFMQKLVAGRSQVVACQRARLQMTRDIRDALQARIEALQHYEDQRREREGVPAVPSTPHLTGDDPLTALWNQVEDEYKKAIASCLEKRKKPLLWPATHLPSTPEGIPCLLSAAAEVPDKTCAFSAKGMFECKDTSLVWLEGHLPLEAEDEKEDDYAEVERLEHQVKRLEAELEKERRHNQETCQKIGATRTRNDEWVAMMCILRQETEAVLHRHNTILQSDQAMAATQHLNEEEEEQEKTRRASANNNNIKGNTNISAGGAVAGATTIMNGGNASENEPLEKTDAMATATGPPPADEANYGDDEGSNNLNEEEEDDWNNNNRRSAEDMQDGSPKGNKKRRIEK